jgi:hypothetical protein
MALAAKRNQDARGPGSGVQNLLTDLYDLGVVSAVVSRVSPMLLGSHHRVLATNPVSWPAGGPETAKQPKLQSVQP